MGETLPVWNKIQTASRAIGPFTANIINGFILFKTIYNPVPIRNTALT